MVVVKADKPSLEELFESIRKALGDRELIEVELDINDGMREVRAPLMMNKSVLFSPDGMRTITLVLKCEGL